MIINNDFVKVYDKCNCIGGGFGIIKDIFDLSELNDKILYIDNIDINKDGIGIFSDKRMRRLVMDKRYYELITALNKYYKFNNIILSKIREYLDRFVGVNFDIGVHLRGDKITKSEMLNLDLQEYVNKIIWLDIK